MQLSDPVNIGLIASRLAVVRCPSASQADHKRIGRSGDPYAIRNPGVTATNYAACSGTFTLSAYYKAPPDRKNGILYEDSSTRIADITDGTSNTILVGEAIYYGDGNQHGAGAFYWDPAWFGHAHGRHGGMADCPECLMRNGEFRMNVPAIANNLRKRNGFGSSHEGGAQFLMADGSVHLISETIHHTARTFGQWRDDKNSLGTYQRLCGRNDGLVLGEF